MRKRPSDTPLRRAMDLMTMADIRRILWDTVTAKVANKELSLFTSSVENDLYHIVRAR
jgi:hypothetical protein